MQSTRKKQKYLIKEDDDIQEDIKTELEPDVEKNIESTFKDTNEMLDHLYRTKIPKQQQLLDKQMLIEQDDLSNQTYTEIATSAKLVIPEELLNNTAHPLSPIVEVLKSSVESAVILADIAAQKANINIQKSEELVGWWKRQLIKLDALIKSLKPSWWNNLFTIGACFSLVVTLLFKMGMLQQIPNFVGTAVSALIDATKSAGQSAATKSSEDFLPTITDTKAIAKDFSHVLVENPGTTILVATSVFGIGFSIAFTKTLIKILRHVR